MARAWICFSSPLAQDLGSAWLDLPVKQIRELHGQRWYIETDFNSLKQTLQLQILQPKSVDMVSKELILSIVGYNLVRAVMNAAAEPEGLDSRRLSFSGRGSVGGTRGLPTGRV